MKKYRSFVVVSAILLPALLLGGCAKRSRMTTSQEIQTERGEAQAAPSTEMAESSMPREEYRAPETSTAVDEKSYSVVAKASYAKNGLQPVYFDFDQASLRADSLAALKSNAEWLKSNPGTKIKIEGNTDERGTKEYNVALGQRRAMNAKKYLMQMGIPAGRISLISLGKEKPVCGTATESCWQKNRRDDFVVVSR